MVASLTRIASQPLFKFSESAGDALLREIDTALKAFQYKEGWKRLMHNVMARGYSWDQPAKEYSALYKEVARKRR